MRLDNKKLMHLVSNDDPRCWMDDELSRIPVEIELPEEVIGHDEPVFLALSYAFQYASTLRVYVNAPTYANFERKESDPAFLERLIVPHNWEEPKFIHLKQWEDLDNSLEVSWWDGYRRPASQKAVIHRAHFHLWNGPNLSMRYRGP